ncbi:MAG: shikimate kinase [Hyphomicrobiaceae bacterium]
MTAESTSSGGASSAAACQGICDRLAGRSIVLVGLMGCGKSSIGRRLAERLGLAFVDADHEIEAAAGCTVTEIFSRYGEAYFRDGERRVIARILEQGRRCWRPAGAFVNEETRARIAEAGISVWLKAELPVLMARVRRRTNRPLLRTDDPEAVMRRLMAERYPVYAEADITVESREEPHEVIIGEIVAALRERLAAPQSGGNAGSGGQSTDGAA